MAKARQFTGGQFIKCDSVEAMSDKERHTTISHVEVEAINGRVKLVMYVKSAEFGLPLNTTNIEELVDAFGTDETDDWEGKAVELYVDPSIRFQGRRVGGVRVRVQGDK
jgi:hypothetical protein